MGRFITQPVQRDGLMRRGWYDLFADGKKFAEVRPTGGDKDSFHIFIDGSPRKYDTGQTAPDGYTIFGENHAIDTAKKIWLNWETRLEEYGTKYDHYQAKPPADLTNHPF